MVRPRTAAALSEEAQGQWSQFKAKLGLNRDLRPLQREVAEMYEPGGPVDAMIEEAQALNAALQMHPEQWAATGSAAEAVFGPGLEAPE